MGERKVALFCCIPDADTSLNYLVGMIYSQLFQTLYYMADRVLQKIAEYFKIPACFLEAIPVKKDLEDDIFHNNGEKENEESTT